MFNVGDTIRQIKSSEYYHQSEDLVGEIKSTGYDDWYRVLWKNGNDNSYQDEHLEYADKKRKAATEHKKDNFRAWLASWQNKLVTKKQATQTYASLLRHPLVSGVIVNNELLTVATKMLKDSERDIGRFTFTVGNYMSSTKYQNLDYDCDGNPHTHIDSNGNPCFGEYSRSIESALERRNLLAVITALINFPLMAIDGTHGYRTKKTWFKDRTKKL